MENGESSVDIELGFHYSSFSWVSLKAQQGQ